MTRCQSVAASGAQCYRFAQPGQDYCWQHPVTAYRDQQAARCAARAAAIADGHAVYPPTPAAPVVVVPEPPAPPPPAPGPGCVDCGSPLPPARCRPCATKLRARQLEILREAHLAGGKLLGMIHLAAGLTPETCLFCQKQGPGRCR